MKKIIALVLTLCTLVCTLTACKSRRDKYLPEDTDTGITDTGITEAETDEPFDPYVAHTYGENPYAGMTKSDLEKLYWDYATTGINNSNYNTPYYFVLNCQSGGHAFSKMTGEVVQLCKDPLCDHKECVYSELVSIRTMAVAKDEIYFILHEMGVGKTYLYAADYNFDNVKKLYTWKELDAPQNIFAYDGKLYYSAPYRDNKETTERVYVFDCAEKKVSLLDVDSDVKNESFIIMSDHYIYYMTYNETNQGDYVRRYDLLTGEDICVIPASVLHPENGDMSLTLRYVEYDQIHLGIEIMKHGTVRDYAFEYGLYNVETGEFVVTGGGRLVGSYIVNFDDHTLIEFSDDPLYDFYVNDEGIFGKANIAGGELQIMQRDTGAFLGTLRFTTDGIPDCVDVRNGTYISDGKCIFVTYNNYKCYVNELNPGYRPVMSRDDIRPWATGYMLIDIENKTEYNIGVAHDMEWIPAK